MRWKGDDNTVILIPFLASGYRTFVSHVNYVTATSVASSI